MTFNIKKTCLNIFLLLFTIQSFPQINKVNTSINKIPFKLVNNHILVNVQVNQSGPLIFILDTGAGSILDINIANELKLSINDHRTTTGMGNNEQAIATANDIVIKVGTLYFQEEKIAVLDLKDIGICGKQVTVDSNGNLKTEPNDLYPGINGVLGAEFFEKFVIEIDYYNSMLIVYDPKTYQYIGQGSILPIDLDRHHIYLNAEVSLPNAKKVRGRFMIDTGLMLPVSLSPYFIKKGQLQPADSTVTIINICGIGGYSQAKIGKLAGLDMRGIIIANPITLFSEASGGIYAKQDFDGHIGNAILRKFKVTFDYSKAQMILE